MTAPPRDVRRQLLGGLLAAGGSAALGTWPAASRAQAPAAAEGPVAAAYPARPIRLLIGYAPGGPTDIVGRTLAQKLQEAWGQSVIPENKPGAGSNIASAEVARAAPDGHTLLLMTVANATNMSMYRNPGYDTLKDLALVTQVMSAPSVLVVGPMQPIRDLRELIAAARKAPGTLTFGSSGAGGSPHLAGELLKQRTGIDITHVPYKGASPALADVVAGNVTMAFMTALSAIPFMKSGRLRPIAVASPRRLAQIADVPTMGEAGVPDFEVSSWNGVAAPARTPPEVVAKLQRQIARILQMPDVREKFEAQAAEAIGSTPDEFRSYVRAEIDKWAEVARVSGARLD